MRPTTLNKWKARWLLCLPLLALACAGLARAQQPQTGPPMGTVSGMVLAQDTQRPVRFAEVQFVALTPTYRQSGDLRIGMGPTRVRTEADGTFTAAVLPGDYYVTATAPGYITEHDSLLTKVNAGADPAQLLSTIPVVHVAAGGSSNSVTLSLERGAALSGSLFWEDGSPVSGQPVSVNFVGLKSNKLPAPLPQLPQSGNNHFATTDDRGFFRVSGMPRGDYVVITTLNSVPFFGPGGGQFGGRSRMSGSAISFYAPGVFHSSQAQVFPLRPGDERNDVRLVMDLRGLHTVSGTVTPVDPNQTVASGSVSLQDTSDSSLRFNTSINKDGTFSLRYVPPGTYTLQVQGATSQPAGGFRGQDSRNLPPSVTFQPLTMTITVTDGDLSGVDLTLTPVAAQTH